MDLVSCIITTYKRKPKVLKRAIDSVINQSYQNKELIVVNDYPEDAELERSIAELINTYEFPIQYIVQPKNMGACKARNTGIEASSGKYIALLDDDDEWMPEKISKQMELFVADNISLVYCDSLICKNENTMHHTCVLPKGSSNTLEGLLQRNFIGGNSFPLMRKESIIQAGLYDEELKALQDIDLWIRICQVGECVHCHEELVINHISDTSITTNINNRIQGYDKLLSKYQLSYKKYPDAYHKSLLTMAGEMSIAGMHKVGRKYYKLALKSKFFSVYNIILPIKPYAVWVRNKIIGI